MIFMDTKVFTGIARDYTRDACKKLLVSLPRAQMSGTSGHEEIQLNLVRYIRSRVGDK